MGGLGGAKPIDQQNYNITATVILRDGRLDEIQFLGERIFSVLVRGCVISRSRMLCLCDFETRRPCGNNSLQTIHINLRS